MSDELEAAAKEFYEASRRKVSGRPPWDRLNPKDPYDMGMKQRAYDEANKALSSVAE
jgi:hypothetical protein